MTTIKHATISWIALAILIVGTLPVFAKELKKGLVVCIGGDALESVAGEWNTPGYVIQCLETSDDSVAKLRQKIVDADCHGKVSVSKFDGKSLPYIDNLVSQVIAGKTCDVPKAEIMRALAPYGVAVIGGKTVTKPYPEKMDEWPQYLHGADNNCVAQDTVVGPPRHVQWISGPPWTRAHIGAATISSMVTSGGRIFTVEDTETAENPLLPAKWRLVARGAFNGVELWSMPYPKWEQITVYIKDYHAQMQRRLVAIGDTVYCTPGLNAPLTALDAETGKVVKEYKGTEKTQEFVYHEGVLYAVTGDRMHFSSYKGTPGAAAGAKKKGGRKNKNKAAAEETAEPESSTPDPETAIAFKGHGFPISAYNPQTGNAENPSTVIVAIDAKSGKELWRSENINRYTGCTMALKGDKLLYQSVEGVFCLDAQSGKTNWAVEKEIPYGKGNSPHSLVLSDEAVYSEEGKSLFAYSLADGSDFWGKSIPARKGYQASTDILIAGGALWTCGSCNSGDGLVKTQPVAFDLKTGEQIRTIDQQLSKPMGHDRCYRNFITERFFINSKTGGPDCMDLETGTEWPASFTRGTCSMGPLPANGLIYCGPWACQCHLPTGLHNFNAFYTNEDSLPTKGQTIDVKQSVRLEKGPAFGHIGDAATDDAPWPTYRGDERRYSGRSEDVPGKGLKPLWKTELSAKLTAPVVAEGKVFVAETETHILRALDAGSGKTLWEYIAGGRIDSPPTYYKGLLIFGSRDGWVQCVRASDGALSWRFRDLPDKMICAFDQLESAWPIHGSVLVKDDTAYFCAGRSSFVDGGLFIYGLYPATGEVRHQRSFYGPYATDRFPAFVEGTNRSENEIILGTTADIMSAEGDTLYVRSQAFNLDLTDAKPGKHLLASSGMLEPNRQHREYKLVKEDFNHRKMWTTEKTEYPTGDIIVSNGTDYYSVFGHPVNRGESFNPRTGYLLKANTRSGEEWSAKWDTRIMITGKAMALAGDTLFVAGAPLVFKPHDFAATYKGEYGSVLLSTSAKDGSTLAELKLDTLPVWDGMASGYGKLFMSMSDGSVVCLGAQQ